jgi:hypothetical protein
MTMKEFTTSPVVTFKNMPSIKTMYPFLRAKRAIYDYKKSILFQIINLYKKLF